MNLQKVTNKNMTSTFQINPNAKGTCPTARPVFFFPGWGFDGRIIELAPATPAWVYPAGLVDPCSIIDNLIRFLEKKRILQIDLVGWSMGANLALDFARAYPKKVACLYLISIRREWPGSEIEQIRAELARDPAAFLISFYRKCFLGYRNAYDRFVSGFQEDSINNINISILNNGLDYLKRVRVDDVRIDLLSGMEVHLIHGRRDIIAPMDQMPELSGAGREILDQEGHLPFLSRNFSLPWERRKKIIRRRFSRAADTYDDYAPVQREAALKLADWLDPGMKAGSILEIGCGTGNFTASLTKRFPEADILALDFSKAMIEIAERKLASYGNVTLKCRDAEHFLAETNKSYDLIASNTTMQWFEAIDTAFASISDRLNDNGLFLCSIFGPETLNELGKGLASLKGREIRIVSGRFCAKDDLKVLLENCFTSVKIKEFRIIREYDSLRDLLTTIKKTGAAGWRNSSQPVLTRGRLERLDKWFAEQNQGYHVTYQVFIIRCLK
ncbi:MAG: malonyl-ACP O-methyltransferase BioC [Thermodesulfobacteriota bacterium]|nr:malonyl-ACP O-methyltransferase BioC [Thermodesulfobacteriota bacterium]